MFGKNKTKNTTPKPTNSSKSTVPSVISSDMNILGNIISEGLVDINGRIEGNVKCHTATIREGGLVKGDVIADTIQIHGEIEGLVKAKTVNLYAEARVTGVIMHESLSIEDGAFVDGKFKRTDRVFVDDESHADLSDQIAQEANKVDEANVLDNLRLISAKD